MKFILEPHECEEIFYNALCNGLSDFSSHGLQLSYQPKQYERARATLAKVDESSNICYEDVLMQILREGGSLNAIDIEGEGDQDAVITLSDVHRKVPEAPIRDLSDMITGNDDAFTADSILQIVFYGEIQFS